jgi:acetylornithine deacetylase/succinyl-diaminopimelate desuccinylase-like protein
LIHSMQPVVQDLEDPVFKIFEKRIKAHDPEAIVMPYIVPGFTDGSNYARLGIKYFGFSPLKLKAGESFQELFHNKNERISLDGYKFGLRVYIETIWEMVTEF